MSQDGYSQWHRPSTSGGPAGVTTGFYTPVLSIGGVAVNPTDLGGGGAISADWWKWTLADGRRFTHLEFSIRVGTSPALGAGYGTSDKPWTVNAPWASENSVNLAVGSLVGTRGSPSEGSPGEGNYHVIGACLLASNSTEISLYNGSVGDEMENDTADAIDYGVAGSQYFGSIDFRAPAP